MRKLIVLLVVMCLPVYGQRFQDNSGTVYIDNGSQVFICPSHEFPNYEPSYELPPAGYIRVWEDGSKSLRKDGNQYPDPFYVNAPSYYALYLSQVTQYQVDYDAAHVTPTPTPEPSIYANVVLSKDTLRIDTQDSLTLSATIEDGQGNVLPVSESWIIRLRDAAGAEVDAFMVSFVDGATGDLTYTLPATIQPGRVFLLESDFLPVTVTGVGTFKVKLLNPVLITIYRIL